LRCIGRCGNGVSILDFVEEYKVIDGEIKTQEFMIEGLTLIRFSRPED
jgi:hypothetical protein